MLYLRFGFTGIEAAVAALGVLTALAVYNAVSARTRDRAEITDQVGNLARGTGDLARQLAEFGRRLSAMETKVETVLDKALSTAQPLAVEIEELSRLVKHLADSVAEHEVALGVERSIPAAAPVLASSRRACPRAMRPSRRTGASLVAAVPPAAPIVPAAAAEPHIPRSCAPPPPEPKIAAFNGLDRDAIIAAIDSAIEAHGSTFSCSRS